MKSGLIGLGISGTISRWPKENWIKLVEKITNSGFNLVFYGGVEDIEFANELSKITKSSQSLVGIASFMEAAKSLRNLELFIGNDTGFSHFSSFYAPKILIIQGGGTFRRFFPWPKSNNQFLIYHGLDCFSCDWRCCHNSKLCLDLITESDVHAYAMVIVKDKDVPKSKNLNQSNVTCELSWQQKEIESIDLTIYSDK